MRNDLSRLIGVVQSIVNNSGDYQWKISVVGVCDPGRIVLFSRKFLKFLSWVEWVVAAEVSFICFGVDIRFLLSFFGEEGEKNSPLYPPLCAIYLLVLFLFFLGGFLVLI